MSPAMLSANSTLSDGEIHPTCCTWASSSNSLVLLNAVKAEVILTYLGIGVQDGASWGLLISGASQIELNGIWWPLAGTVSNDVRAHLLAQRSSAMRCHLLNGWS